MTAEQNRRVMEQAFEGLARGDNTAFGALMGEDFTWTAPGTMAWSGTFHGRESCVRDLFRPIYAQFTETQMVEPISFTAQGDLVIVEGRGRRIRLKNGRTYQNEYCYVCRFEDGRLKSVREYLDTAAMVEALDPPPWAGTRLPEAASQG
jgi:ketosteroid isomerase-like protein